MSVCQHRPEPGGMWQSCQSACGSCACGAEVVEAAVEGDGAEVPQTHRNGPLTASGVEMGLGCGRSPVRPLNRNTEVSEDE